MAQDAAVGSGSGLPIDDVPAGEPASVRELVAMGRAMRRSGPASLTMVAKAHTKGAVAEAAPQPIVLGENVSQPVLTTAEAVAKDMTMPDHRFLATTVEEAPVPDAPHASPGDRRTRRKKLRQKDGTLPRDEG